MKTVRLSGSLLDDIKQNIKSAYDRVNPNKEYPGSSSFEGYEVLKRYDVLDKIEKTKSYIKEVWGTDEMLEERELDYVRIKCQLETNVDDEGQTHYETKSFKLGVTDVMVPTILLGSSSYERTLSVQVDPDDETLVKCQEVKMFNSNNEDKKWQQVEQFEQLIEQHNITTLNQLLKAAPWLEAHVPADRLQKMNEKDERVKREQQQREFAEDAMSEIRETLLEDKLTGDIFNE